MAPPQGRDAGHGTRLAALAAAALAACTGLEILGTAVTAEARPPEPPRTAHSSAPHPPARREPAPLPRARPKTITIPSIGVHSKLLRLGLAPDGAIDVPRPPQEDRAGWFTGSVAPGARGTSVIVGHVDSRTSGASVFYRLGTLEPGRRIMIDRADGTTAVFAVDTVRRHPKDDFPSTAVYAHTPRPSLRLITCGGEFDDDTGHYLDNTVVYAHFVAAT